jgi:hypothetical protein
VNPYAASREAQPRSSHDEPAQDGIPTQRQYQARMDWADRRDFLKSVGPTRVAVVFGGLLWLKSIYDLTRIAHAALTMGPLTHWGEIVVFALVLLSLSQGLVAIYLCWLDWKYADFLREVAGGSTTNMTNWSRLHLRTAWLGAAVAILGLAAEIGRWLVDQVLTQRLFPA